MFLSSQMLWHVNVHHMKEVHGTQHTSKSPQILPLKRELRVIIHPPKEN